MHRRVSKFVSIVIGLTFSLMTLNPAHGQAISGNIVGTVLDSSSAVISNATVEIVKVDTGAISSIKTSATGAYRFENLPVGSYKLTVKSDGFKTAVQQVDVALNQTGTLNVTLVPGGASEVVEVTTTG